MNLINTHTETPGKQTMDFTFRLATDEDYDVILALDPEHEIYEGEDYFPSQLQRYFKDPNKTVLLCSHEGRVVSMEVRTRHNFICLLNTLQACVLA